jgi:hypothetical protein
MRLSSLPFRVAAFGLVLVAASVLTSVAAAQGRSAEDTRTITGYRLTMPMLRKVLPAMYAPGARSCEPSRRSDPALLSLAQMTRKLESCSPVAKSLERVGVQPREAAVIYAALLNVSQQVARRGGKASELPPGVVRDNALLLEQNDPEIRKLIATGGQS